MKIRKAEKKDIFAIGKLIKEMAIYHKKFDKSYKTYFGNKLIKSYIGDFLNDKNRIVLVAEEKNNIIGYIFGSIKKYPIYILSEKSGYLDEMFVKVDFRKKDIGKKLFFEFLKWLKLKGAKDITLSVDKRNKKSLKVWKKLGFHAHGSVNKIEMGFNFN